MIYQSQDRIAQHKARLLWLMLFVLLGPAQACNNTPDYVMDEQTYIKMIAEFQLGKAYLQVSKDSLGYLMMKDSVFSHYGVTQADFDTSHAFFEKDLDQQIIRYQKAQAYIDYVETGALYLLNTELNKDTLNLQPSTFD